MDPFDFLFEKVPPKSGVMRLTVRHLSPFSLSQGSCLVPRYSPLAEDAELCFGRVGDFVRQLWAGREAFAEGSLLRLVAMIEQQVHVKFRRQSPWIIRMLSDIKEQAERNPSFRVLQVGFYDLWSQLQHHIIREEVMLFPFLRKINADSQRRDLLLGRVYGGVFAWMNQSMLGSWAELERSVFRLGALLENIENGEVLDESTRCVLSVLDRYLQSLQAALDLESEQLFPQIQQLLAFGNLTQTAD